MGLICFKISLMILILNLIIISEEKVTEVKDSRRSVAPGLIFFQTGSYRPAARLNFKISTSEYRALHAINIFFLVLMKKRHCCLNMRIFFLCLYLYLIFFSTDVNMTTISVCPNYWILRNLHSTSSWYPNHLIDL